MSRRTGNGAHAPNTLVPANVETVNKFGRNPSISTTNDPQDVWGAGGLYPFPAAPVALEIVSSDAADDKDAGTGAQLVVIQGLDAAGILQEVTVEPEGLTPANITGTWLRVFRAFVTTVGTGGVNAGTLLIRAQGAGTTYAQIDPDEGQTTMAIYTVPAGKVGRLFRHWATFDRAIAGTATIHVMVRMAGESWQNKQAFTISDGKSWDFTYEAGGIDLGPLTDIRIEVDEVSANSTAVDAGFDLWLKDA